MRSGTCCAERIASSAANPRCIDVRGNDGASTSTSVSMLEQVGRSCGLLAEGCADAIIDSNGSISKGHEEIRKIVTSLIQRRDDNKAKGLPTSNLYHVISNVRITFPTPGEALHQSYWQTVRRDKDGKMTAAAMGRSEDRLVKRNGKWLIQSRKLTVFTD